MNWKMVLQTSLHFHLPVLLVFSTLAFRLPNLLGQSNHPFVSFSCCCCCCLLGPRRISYRGPLFNSISSGFYLDSQRHTGSGSFM